MAGRPVRPRAPADRGGPGTGLRQRAGPARRRADAGFERGRQLHRAALRSNRQLEIAQATARNFNATLAHLELRFKGRHRLQDRSDARSARRRSRPQAAIPAFEQAIAVQENLISILLGRNPGPIPRGRTIDQLAGAGDSADLPAALLQSRPDILQAEQNLVAANASMRRRAGLVLPEPDAAGGPGQHGDGYSAACSAGRAAGLSGPPAWPGPVSPFPAIGGSGGPVPRGRRPGSAAGRYQQTRVNGIPRDQRRAQTVPPEAASRTECAARARGGPGASFGAPGAAAPRQGIAGYLDVLVAENELFARPSWPRRAAGSRTRRWYASYQAWAAAGWKSRPAWRRSRRAKSPRRAGLEAARDRPICATGALPAPASIIHCPLTCLAALRYRAALAGPALMVTHAWVAHR